MEKLLRGQLQQHCSYSIISCKFPIFGNHPKQVRLLWNRNGLSLLPRRLRPNLLPLLLLPRTLLLHIHSLPTRNFVPIPGIPFHPLLRPRIPHFLSPMCSLTTPPEQPPPPDSNSIKTERVVVKGRVQGVFYRDWTVQNATDLGLKGWVRNRRDGSVEALFSGPPEKVQEMEQRCRRGPPAAAVTGFQVFSSNDDPGTGFERRSTV